jgi:hypothetical protein
MKRFNDSKITLLLLAFVLALMLTPASTNADFKFGEPVKVESVMARTAGWYWNAIDCLSYDGLEMYITLPQPGGDLDLCVLKRSSIEDDCGPAENLGPAVNSSGHEHCPSISSDGLTLYFDSKRDGGYGGWDLYMTTRSTRNSPWGTAVNMGPTINSSSTEIEPWISSNGLELYFSIYGRGGYGATDVWVTRRSTEKDPWGEPVNIGPVVNTAFEEQYLSLSPDGLLLLFSDCERCGGFPARPGGYGGDDIWMTRRASLSDPWQAPVNLGPKINGPFVDAQPRISPDGRTLYFFSSRPYG